MTALLFFGFMERSWRPFLYFLFGFGLHEAFMATLSGFPSVFRLHEAVMATFSGFTNRSWRPFLASFSFLLAAYD
ncbi:hypothetical protein [Cytobacillus oceanisediminis]|uniref:hypothetical protein n=1 Tax=Cytobacillus oceanisediminis TaxID=665099 RepID=UPI002494B046|nr:hypothetical protein [Cytobacillus oceanisediminis]